MKPKKVLKTIKIIKVSSSILSYGLKLLQIPDFIGCKISSIVRRNIILCVIKVKKSTANETAHFSNFRDVEIGDLYPLEPMKYSILEIIDLGIWSKLNFFQIL